MMAEAGGNAGNSRRLKCTAAFCHVLFALVFYVVPLVEPQLCDVDEYYDPVVESCALCQDVCDQNLSQYCRNVCPDYYIKTYTAQLPAVIDNQDMKQPEFAVLRPSSLQTQTMSSKTAWTDNPLYWVIIGSSVVAVIAFVAIVMLLICIKRQRQIEKLEEGSLSGTGKRADSCSTPAGYTAVSSCSSTPSSESTELENTPPNTPASYDVIDDCIDVKKPMMTKATQVKPVSRPIAAES